MKRYFLFLSVLATLLVSGCGTGKRLLQSGQYDEAVLASVRRLRQDPDNEKATQTLRDAYPLAKDYHLRNIALAKESTDIYRWERVADTYAKLNVMADEIRRCPACLNIIPSPAYYSSELNDAKINGAEVRYALGVKAMENKTRSSARDAYEHFMASMRLMPNFKDAASKAEEAKFHATLKVLVEPIPMHSNQLKLSNEFFENKIREFLIQMPVNEFVRFYNPKEAEAVGLTQPDQIISMSFDDFIIGQTSLKETVLPCKKDSVEIAKDSAGKPIYGTVTAQLHQFSKTVVSTGLLDFKIFDPNTKQTLTNEKLPGTFNWFCEWGYYNGDSRALTLKQLEITKNKEIMPPPPQDLFISFCKPIHDQITGKIRNFYKNY
ncbi:MAG: hypothetical protein ACKOYC_10265 [Bacteroidota bacterium]